MKSRVLEGLGVKLVCNTFIGQDKTLDELFTVEVLTLIFIGTGYTYSSRSTHGKDEVHGVLQAM